MQRKERVFMSATRDGKMWRCQFYYEDWQGIRHKEKINEVLRQKERRRRGKEISDSNSKKT